MTMAPCVAIARSVTIPVAGPPPPRRAGTIVTDAMNGPLGAGVVVIVANRVVPPACALISENCPSPVLLTDVLTANVTLVAPARTTTDAGTFATVGVVEASVTVVLLVTADAIVTVPCAEIPPTMMLGVITSEVTAAPVGAGGVTMSGADCATPPYAAEIETDAANVTVCAATTNVAVVAPAGTETVAGTAARDGSALERFTVAPPAGAGPESVTVPVDVAPPAIIVGENVSDAAVTPDGITVNTAVCVTLPAVAEMAANEVDATG